MASLTKLLEAQVASWPNVSVASHRFGGREFRFQKAEIGHVHFWGDVDIPFPSKIHDILIADGRVQRHRWVPDSGWVTFRMSSADDLDRALWLMRLSYLRYALKNDGDPHGLLRREAEHMQIDTRIVALLGQFIPRTQPVLS